MQDLSSISNKSEIIILFIVLFIFVIFIFNNITPNCGCNKTYKKNTRNPYIIID